MNTIKNQFSIGIDGNYHTIEARTSFMTASHFHKSEGASLIRGR